jgi:hypothetical protein
LESFKFSRDALTDLLPAATDGPFDSAKAKTTVTKTTDGTEMTIRVTGIDTSALPEVLPVGGIGAHLHVGPCVDDPATPTVIEGPGLHFNTDMLANVSPPEVSPRTELWFNLLPDEYGMAYDETSVKFVPVDADGKMSIVIHEGSAAAGGTKQSCFPLSVSGIFPEPPTE